MIIYVFVCLYVCKRVDISMSVWWVVICYAMLLMLWSMIEEHHSCKSNAPLHVKQDTLHQYTCTDEISRLDFQVLRFNGMGQNVGQHMGGFKVIHTLSASIASHICSSVGIHEIDKWQF